MNDEKKKKSEKYSRSSEYLGHDHADFSKAAAQQHSDGGNEAAAAAAAAANAEQAAEIKALKEEMEQVKAKSTEYFDGWARERADFQNYKRRVERDQAMQTQDITGRIIKRFLAVQDDLERALKNRPAGGEMATWAEGIELVNRKLASILESENVVRIEAEGQQFDPNLHEALSHEDSNDHESGQIIEVIQQGYMLGDRVLRPALVRVAR